MSVIVDPILEAKLVEVARAGIRAGRSAESVRSEVSAALDAADADLGERAGKVAEVILTCLAKGDDVAKAQIEVQKAKVLQHNGVGHRIHPGSIPNTFTNMQHLLAQFGSDESAYQTVVSYTNEAQAARVATATAVDRVINTEVAGAKNLASLNEALSGSPNARMAGMKQAAKTEADKAKRIAEIREQAAKSPNKGMI